VSVRVTAPSERTRTVPSFGALVGAQAAVNGGFYNTPDQSQTDGFVLHNGASWGGTDHDYVGPIGLRRCRVELVPHERVAGPAGVDARGRLRAPHPRRRTAPPRQLGRHRALPAQPAHRRRALADRRTLILAVVDGRNAPRGWA
jgi:hypothetical protein